MRKYACLPLLIFPIMMTVSACTVLLPIQKPGNTVSPVSEEKIIQEKINEENFVQEQMRDDTIGSVLGQDPPYVSQTAVHSEKTLDFSLVMRDIDMNGDGYTDTITVSPVPNAQSEFLLRIALGGNNGTIEHVFPAGLFPESKFYCADITNDGLPDILLDNLYYSSNMSDIRTSIISVTSDCILEIPLGNSPEPESDPSQWEIGSLHISEVMEAFQIKLQNDLTEKDILIDLRTFSDGTLPSSGVRKKDILIEQKKQYVVSCHFEELENKKIGIRVNRFLELDIILKGDPPQTYAATVIVSSVIEWSGNWVLREQQIVNMNDYFDLEQSN